MDHETKVDIWCLVGILVAAFVIIAAAPENPPMPEQRNYSQSHTALGSTYWPRAARH